MPQILDIYPGTIVNLVSACTMVCSRQQFVWACLQLRSIDYLLTRCLSKEGWDQITAYHQLITWTNGTNQLRASLDQNETRAMFCPLWGALLWPIKNNPVCGEQRDGKKPKLQPKIAGLGKTYCLERSRIYDGSGLVHFVINNIDSPQITLVRVKLNSLGLRVRISSLIALVCIELHSLGLGS